MISNKTRAPLSIPLPRGKKLHLGPGKTGDIAATALEHPPVKKLVEAGSIEILGDAPRATDYIGRGNRGRASTQGHSSTSTTRSSGDR
jgi:hypothetical protein